MFIWTVYQFASSLDVSYIEYLAIIFLDFICMASIYYFVFSALISKEFRREYGILKDADVSL
ncbi:MAG: hypothetical protein WCQ23_07220 [Candidatus Methanomethylophilaceae archaeon]|jgi:hypothetical protein